MKDKTDIELLAEILNDRQRSVMKQNVYSVPLIFTQDQVLHAFALKEKQMQGEINRLKLFDGNDDHPENRCQRCTGRNLHNWYADNETWNKVVGDKFNQLCPNCFTELAKEAGIDPAAWRLSMEGDLPEVDILRDQNFHLNERLYQLQNQLSDLSDEYELNLCKKCLHPKAMLYPGEYQCVNTGCNS